VNSLAVKLWLSVVLLAVAAYGAYSGVKALRRHEEMQSNPKSRLSLRPIRPLADFEFTERDGRKVRLAELEGKVFVVNFFFANCPGTCRILNDKIATLHKKFGPEGVQFVSVTIDPSSDTPDRLANYAKAFGADEHWWYVTGPLENTQDLAHAMHLATPGYNETGSLTHTDEIVVVDRAGVIRGAFDHRDPEKLKAAGRKIEELLAEKPDAKAVGTPTTSPKPGPAQTGSPSATSPSSTPAATGR
jgi:protein SCO1/2